jgi:hypothetical protein
MSNETLFSVARDGATLGNFTLGQLRTSFRSGQFTAKDHYWTSGMTGWEPLANLADKFKEMDVQERERAAEAALRRAQEAAQRQAEARSSAPAPQPAASQAAAQVAVVRGAPPAGQGGIDAPVALGAGLIFAGAFCPIVSVRLLEGLSLNAIGNGSGELTAAAALTGYTFVQAVRGYRKGVHAAFLAGVALLAIPLLKVLYKLWEVGDRLSRLSSRGGRSESADSGFSYDPFSGPHLGILELIPLPFTLQIGFALILAGTLVLHRLRPSAT